MCFTGGGEAGRPLAVPTSAPTPSAPTGRPDIPCTRHSTSWGRRVIVVVLLLYRTQTTWPGLLIVLTGIPAYLIWHRGGRAKA